MENSQNFNFNLPGEDDQIDIVAISDNFKVIDKNLCAFSDVKGTVSNSYGYLLIDFSGSVDDLVGKVVFVKPMYTNTSTSVSFGTNSEGVWYNLCHYDKGTKKSGVLVGSIVADSVMAIYVDENKDGIYLNPVSTGSDEIQTLVETSGIFDPMNYAITSSALSQKIEGESGAVIAHIMRGAYFDIAHPWTINGTSITYYDGSNYSTLDNWYGSTTSFGYGSLDFYCEYNLGVLTSVIWLNCPN